MKYYKSIFPLLIFALFFSGNIKQNRERNGITQSSWTGSIRNVNAFKLSTGISIGDKRVVEDNSGQKSVAVMLTISPVASVPVTVSYSTKDGTATAGSDYIAANGSITFAKGEMMKRILVSIIGDVVCEADETFEILLSDPSGATLADNVGTVTIVNDDLKCSGVSGSGVSGSGFPGSGNRAGNLSVYEVRFTYTGYTSLYGTASNCSIRTNGKVVLTGLLAGAENVDPDDDIMYTGVLQLDIDMDICSMTRLPNGEDKQCGLTVVGSGPVNTELEIQSDQRGGYIKIENKSGWVVKNVYGSCDQQQEWDERDMVPNKTIASIFNGYELPKLTDRTLRAGRYVTTNDAGETVVEVLRKLQ